MIKIQSHNSLWKSLANTWSWAGRRTLTGENTIDMVAETPHLVYPGLALAVARSGGAWRSATLKLGFLETCSCFTSLSDTWCKTCESSCACPGSQLLVWLGMDAARPGMASH